ncbi:MAG: VCBS repeat-containing protein [Verrucomicrobiaceae bacterium]|nr:VCBS repeat-containing protein [Verrucomicrobiaceae bacterium]
MRLSPLLLLTLASVPIEAEQPLALRLSEPEVIKLGWNTRCPRVGDFNDDGRQDIVLINQDRSRIEFLLQGKDGPKMGQPEKVARNDVWNPVLEVSRFEKQPLVIGSSMMALVTGDWNGDKRADIAYTTDDAKLVLRIHGKESADWTQKKEFTLDSVSDNSDSLLAADLNDDKLTDIIVITQTRWVIYLQAGKGEWKEARSYALTSRGASAPHTADLNSDGRVDLFCTQAEGTAILVRLQSPEGDFGEEWRLEIAAGQSWVKNIHLGKESAFAWLQSNTGMVEIAKLTKTASAQDADRAASITHAIPPSESKVGASAFGDITGDGVADVVIAESKAARIWLFQGRADGSFDQGKEYPTLSGVEVMVVADPNGDKKPDLVILSPAEKTIAVSSWSGSRIDYPTTVLQSPDALVGLAVGRFADVKEAAIVTFTESKPKPNLLVSRWSAGDKKYQTSKVEISTSPSRVTAISLLDADQDDRGDVILFSALSPVQMLLNRADAKTALKKVEGLADSITSKLAPSSISLVDLEADGKKELLIVKDQLARIIHVDKNGQARVADQINAPDAGTQITTAITVGNADVTKRRVLLVDGPGQKLHELRAKSDGVFRAHSTKALGTVGTPDDVQLINGASGQRLLLLKRQSFEVVPLSGESYTLSRLATFTTELRDTSPVDLITARFTRSDVDDLMLLDNKKSRVAEFFRSDSAEHKSWRSFMFFRIFQADPHYRGKGGYEFEPHDYATMDLNGDGRMDLCLLVHDRMLLYVQE